MSESGGHCRETQQGHQRAWWGVPPREAGPRGLGWPEVSLLAKFPRLPPFSHFHAWRLGCCPGWSLSGLGRSARRISWGQGAAPELSALCRSASPSLGLLWAINSFLLRQAVPMQVVALSQP